MQGVQAIRDILDAFQDMTQADKASTLPFRAHPELAKDP